MGKRIYVNVSQEGQDDIDDLCEFGFVQNLKLTSESYQSGVALRISEEGLSYLKANLDDASRDAVDALIFKEGDLVDVAYQTASQSFKIYTRSGWYARTSTITDIETVSYVSSPFVPRVASSRQLGTRGQLREMRGSRAVRRVEHQGPPRGENFDRRRVLAHVRVGADGREPDRGAERQARERRARAGRFFSQPRSTPSRTARSSPGRTRA